MSVGELRALGFDKRAVHRRVAAGRLHRIHFGVYAVGHSAITFEGRCLAATLACAGTVVSHRSAAGLWGMLPQPEGWVEITIPSSAGRRKRRGLVIHRSPSLAAAVQEIGERLVLEHEGIPLTAPARTLRDLQRTCEEGVVQRALRRALDLRLVAPDVLGAHPDLTRSALERRFLGLCRRHRVPVPEVNARIRLAAGSGRSTGRRRSVEVDFLWREQRVVAETDGWRYHRDRAAFEEDRAKDVALEAAGYRVLRFTHRQIEDQAADVAASLRVFLERAPGG